MRSQKPQICAELTVTPMLLGEARMNVLRKLEMASRPRSANRLISQQEMRDLALRSELYRTLELTHPANRMN